MEESFNLIEILQCPFCFGELNFQKDENILNCKICREDFLYKNNIFVLVKKDVYSRN